MDTIAREIGENQVKNYELGTTNRQNQTHPPEYKGWARQKGRKKPVNKLFFYVSKKLGLATPRAQANGAMDIGT